MTDAHIKEQISKHIAGLLASKDGFIFEEKSQDYGVDFSITKVKKFLLKQQNRYRDSGKKIDFQLKCTTEKKIIRINETIKYDLNVVNYDDLIYRKNEKAGVPLILVVLILPNNSNSWFIIENKQLIVNIEGFWFHPIKEALISKNKYQERIAIPLKNKIGIDLFTKLFKQFYHG